VVLLVHIPSSDHRGDFAIYNGHFTTFHFSYKMCYMKYKLIDLWLHILHQLATMFENIAYWFRQKAIYNRWTTCPYCLIENGYGHKFDCPKAKGFGDD
jgi:hypothetical protein